MIVPTVSEVAALMAQLRGVRQGADPIEREAYLKAKREILARIEVGQ